MTVLKLQTILTLHFEKLLHLDRVRTRTKELLDWKEKHRAIGLGHHNEFRYEIVTPENEHLRETELDVKERISWSTLRDINDIHTEQRQKEFEIRIYRIKLGESLDQKDIDKIHYEFDRIIDQDSSDRSWISSIDTQIVPYINEYYPFYTDAYIRNQDITTKELKEAYILGEYVCSYEGSDPSSTLVQKGIYVYGSSDAFIIQERNRRKRLIDLLQIFNESELHFQIGSIQPAEYTYIINLQEKLISSEASRENFEFLISEARKYEKLTVATTDEYQEAFFHLDYSEDPREFTSYQVYNEIYQTFKKIF
jgi:hypothetical protein